MIAVCPLASRHLRACLSHFDQTQNSNDKKLILIWGIQACFGEITVRKGMKA